MLQQHLCSASSVVGAFKQHNALDVVRVGEKISSNGSYHLEWRSLALLLRLVAEVGEVADLRLSIARDVD